MLRIAIPAAAALALAAAAPVQAAVLQVFEANADTAAALAPTVDAFRAALGPLNAPAPVNGDPNGRREINWDAAPDAVSDPNPFPGDFFNADVAPRARGIEFLATGDTTGFALSSTAASGEPVEFGFSGGFTFFSAERLFTPVGGETFDVLFFDPADQDAPATTRGFGLVFTDVESATGAEMVFFDRNDAPIFSSFVLPGGNASLSFLGVLFTEAEVARVSVTAGLGGFDSIVMDDVIFGEPISAAAVPLPAPALMLLAGLAGFGVVTRRRG